MYGPDEKLTLEQWKAEQKEFAIILRDHPDRDGLMALRERAFGPKVTPTTTKENK